MGDGEVYLPEWMAERQVPAERLAALARTLLVLAAGAHGGQVPAETVEYALCRFKIPLPSLSGGGPA
jgi:hypothetical protein